MNRLVLFLSLLLPLSANAEPYNITANFPCFPFEEMRKEMRQDHNEVPVISGNGATRLIHPKTGEPDFVPHGMYIFANQSTYDFTLVFTIDGGDRGEIGCIVSSGNSLGPVIQDRGI